MLRTTFDPVNDCILYHSVWVKLGSSYLSYCFCFTHQVELVVCRSFSHLRDYVHRTHPTNNKLGRHLCLSYQIHALDPELMHPFVVFINFTCEIIMLSLEKLLFSEMLINYLKLLHSFYKYL